jgi:hypothetical protein
MALRAEKGFEMSELNKFEVVGTIVDVVRKSVGQRNTLLVEVTIEQQWQDWQGAESVNPLVAKVLGKRADSMFNPGPDIGDHVSIAGFIEGRSWKDRLYLDLQIDTITVLAQAIAEGVAQEVADDSVDDDEVPF